MLTGGALIALGFFVIVPALRRLVAAEVRRESVVEVEPHWYSILEQRVPAARALSQLDRTRLLKSARGLITTRHWEGCGGLALDLEMQIVIASQACILTLAVPGDAFPGLREILVYPAGFLAKRGRDVRQWIGTADHEQPVPELGEAWGNGVIVLGWEAALEGATDSTDGSNLVFHEFAHQFAYERHLTPPPIEFAALPGFADIRPVVKDPDAWRRVLDESYGRRCDKRDALSVLDTYATTNLAEFFAVATEVFFERPEALQAEDAELYAQLVSLYGRDPRSQAVR